MQGLWCISGGQCHKRDMNLFIVRGIISASRNRQASMAIRSGTPPAGPSGVLKKDIKEGAPGEMKDDPFTLKLQFLISIMDFPIV